MDVDLVLGGFHLAGATMERRIDATATDLSELERLRILAPGHCAGWRAKAAPVDRFAPVPARVWQAMFKDLLQ